MNHGEVASAQTVGFLGRSDSNIAITAVESADVRASLKGNEFSCRTTLPQLRRIVAEQFGVHAANCGRRVFDMRHNS